VSLLFRQVASALFLLIGLIISLSWYEWKDSPIWMLFLGGFIALLGIIGVVLSIMESEERLEK
jgi:membrane protein YdbS with pleckstrin-like domain